MDPSRLANTSVIGLASLFLAIGAFVGSAGFARPQSPGSSKNAAIPTEPPPAASPLGASNNLPTPYLLGVSWGQLPDGRAWGSTAGIAVRPDGTAWADVRRGAHGSRATS